jgi:hypothetical protein
LLCCSEPDAWDGASSRGRHAQRVRPAALLLFGACGRLRYSLNRKKASDAIKGRSVSTLTPVNIRRIPGVLRA